RPASPRRRAGERAPRWRPVSSPGTLLAAPQSREQVLRPRGLRRRRGLAYHGDGRFGRDRPRGGLPLALRAYRSVHRLAVRLVSHLDGVRRDTSASSHRVRPACASSSTPSPRSPRSRGLPFRTTTSCSRPPTETALPPSSR